MTESYNLRTFYDRKLQFTYFLWQKATIYALFMTESKNFTYFLWQKATIYARFMTESYNLRTFYDR
jgi:hypothetical protein